MQERPVLVDESSMEASISPGELSLSPPTLRSPQAISSTLPSETAMEPARLQSSLGTLEGAAVSTELRGETSRQGDNTASSLQLKDIQKVQATTVQDCIVLNRKTEFLENRVRRLNLRLLNFPKVMGEQPRVTLRRYLIEVLHISSEDIPAFNKVYFLPFSQSREDRNYNQLDMGNLTDFFESSTTDIMERATLLISFIYENDMGLIMRNYFQNMGTQFMGQFVEIFPDLVKATQERRRGFLALRQETRLLGANYQLRYPCRCVVKFNNNTYIFLIPKHLKMWLNFQNRLMNVSSPIVSPIT
ncbi:uncharacterized protein LOC115090289 [Rhinatrema bivittatum]|uniref:uncharacterized protein LOC115090289 n=1 Tax=Rhinatrema bivittatum TaxID=194408 RepID=UPI00112AD731|nr:uncharacterized protein LOC115090289 [Rhinatrema bivittatum]